MTIGLIKLHKYIWFTLSLCVPILIAFAIVDLQISFHDKTGNNQELQVGKSSENEMISTRIINRDSIHILQVLLKKPLKHPSSNIYTLQGNSKGKFIGQLNSVGIYSFEIEEIPGAILVYDDIKETVITQINLSWE